MSIVSICLIRILALRPPVLRFQLPSLLLVTVLFVLLLLFVVVLSGTPRQKQGEVGRPQTSSSPPPPPPPPSNFIVGRPKAALLFCFFDGFRCAVPLFSLFLLYININIGKNRCYMLD